MVYVLLLTILMKAFGTASGLVEQMLARVLGFMKVLMPSFVLALGLSGGTVTGAVFLEWVLLLISVVEAVMEKLAAKPISVHCWQGDDVLGFDQEGGLSGGIQTTGNYPGRARTFEELTCDFEAAMALVPGAKRINLHASYAVFTDENPWVDRDAIEYKHFEPWVAWAKEHGYGIDFNPTLFSHPMVKEGLTVSSPDKDVRDFWIRHCIACRKIAERIGEELDDMVLNNFWIPDGLKDYPADRFGMRERLRDALDEIYSFETPHVIDAMEQKVFGIGVEGFTTGNQEFYVSYAAKKGGNHVVLIDAGHFNPMENIADKLSSLLLFFPYVPLHVTRSMHWDSDHVVLFDDNIKEIAGEIVRCPDAGTRSSSASTSSTRPSTASAPG